MGDIQVRKIITHGGIFHADEVLAIALLKRFVEGEWIVERRDPTQEELNDPEVFCIDVGGVYDVQRGCFDHHQPVGAGWRGNEIPYASAGLVLQFLDPIIGSKLVTMLDQLVQQVDAVDNGYQIFDSRIQGVDFPFSFSSVISSFNRGNKEDFGEALDLVSKILQNQVSWFSKQERAVDIVGEAFSKMQGGALILREFVPWQNSLFAWEASAGVAGEVKFVVYPSLRGGWNIQGIPVSPGARECRYLFPEAFRGLEGKELAALSGIPGAKFCHKGGFIAGAEDLDSAVKMAREAIKKAGCR